MGDIVDQVLAERKASVEMLALEHRIELERSETVRNYSGLLWSDLVQEIRRLVEKYNQNTSERMHLQFVHQASRFEVRRHAFPVVELTAAMTTPQVWEYWTDRTEGSFAKPTSTTERIQLRAAYGDVYFLLTNNGTVPTVSALAGILLKPCL